MICEACHGNRFVTRSGKTEPCWECLGGVAYCCDGICEEQLPASSMDRTSFSESEGSEFDSRAGNQLESEAGRPLPRS